MIEAFALGEGVLYVNDPPMIESVSSDSDDIRFSNVSWSSAPDVSCPESRTC